MNELREEEREERVCVYSVTSVNRTVFTRYVAAERGEDKAVAISRKKESERGKKK
jgi:hypothetical protein